VALVVVLSAAWDEALSAFLATLANDVATGLGAHAGTETVLVLTRSLGWLKGPFHDACRLGKVVLRSADTARLGPGGAQGVGMLSTPIPLSIGRYLAAIDELLDVVSDSEEAIPVGAIVELGQTIGCFVQERSGILKAALDGAFIVCDARKDTRIERLAVDDEPVELGLLGLGGLLDQVDDRKGQFALLQVGPEGLPGICLVSKQIEAVIVDLVSGTKLHTVVPEVLSDSWVIRRDPSGPFSSGSKEGSGLHLDDLEIVFLAQIQVETSLGLDNLASADVLRSLRDQPWNGGILKF
jgi:hypothetical protein